MLPPVCIFMDAEKQSDDTGGICVYKEITEDF